MRQRTSIADEQGRSTRDGLAPYAVHIVANPMAGKDEPFFGPLAAAFGDARIRWTVHVTNGPGEESELTRHALAQGAEVVVAFGGDGTVSAVADALDGTGALLGILPGGTANVFARELGVPLSLEAAAKLLAGPYDVRTVDLGTVRFGDGTSRSFILRASVGLEAVAVEAAPREEKEKLGELAYVISALRQLPNPPLARYELRNEAGECVETDGLFAVLANSGHIGAGEAMYAPGIGIDDGLLDGLIAPAAVQELVTAAAAALRGGEADVVEHLRGRTLSLRCDPPQRVTVDGEPLGETPVTVSVRPGAVRVLVPPRRRPINDSEKAPPNEANA